MAFPRSESGSDEFSNTWIFVTYGRWTDQTSNNPSGNPLFPYPTAYRGFNVVAPETAAIPIGGRGTGPIGSGVEAQKDVRQRIRITRPRPASEIDNRRSDEKLPGTQVQARTPIKRLRGRQVLTILNLVSPGYQQDRHTKPCSRPSSVLNRPNSMIPHGANAAPKLSRGYGNRRTASVLR